jgi:soluble lytic murein transglycosylase-like protein
MRAISFPRIDRAREPFTRQALGLVVLVLALSGAYTASRMDVAELTADAEQAVEVVAEEPAPARLPDINAHINEVATRYGVSPRLVAAIVAVESGYNSRAVSRRGAEGLMQLMPRTAAQFDVQDAFDPRDNIEGGVRHLKRLMKRFNNDVPLVLAAYNAGEQPVIAHKGIPPYRETRQYVVRVLRRYDREQARMVAQQLAGPPARPIQRVTRVILAERAEATTMATTIKPPAPPARVAEDFEGVPPGPKLSESP